MTSGTSTFSLLKVASNNCNASLGPGSAVREKGKKRGQTGVKRGQTVSWGGRKGRHSFPFPDYRSAFFSIFFSPTLIFFFFPQCGAWSQATVMHMSSACPIASLSIRRFWGKGERWKRKRERASPPPPSPLPHLKSPLP